MILPSKELLNYVLPFAGITSELLSFGLNVDGDLLLQYHDIDEIINIHELAHKCKEWAYSKRCTLLPHRIEKYPNNNYLMLVESINFGWDDLMLSVNKKIKTEDFCADTEPEAIFKACEWILKQKLL